MLIKSPLGLTTVPDDDEVVCTRLVKKSKLELMWTKLPPEEGGAAHGFVGWQIYVVGSASTCDLELKFAN